MKASPVNPTTMLRIVSRLRSASWTASDVCHRAASAWATSPVGVNELMRISAVA